MRPLVLVLSGASGTALAARFASMAAACGAFEQLHVVVTAPAGKVLAHELGSEWCTAAGFCAQVAAAGDAASPLVPWTDAQITAPIASGSVPTAGVVVLPCSAGMAGALAHGISRGLGQRVADVALKQRWPLVLGVRETPMSAILLDNLLRLARAGAHVVPPLPAFYLKPDREAAMDVFVEHYCLRVLDLLGVELDREDLRWRG